MSKKLLLHSLRLQLNQPIKLQKEKNFIWKRLEALDRQFCAGLNLQLHASLLANQLPTKVCPVSFRACLLILIIPNNLERSCDWSDDQHRRQSCPFVGEVTSCRAATHIRAVCDGTHYTSMHMSHDVGFI